MKKITLIGFIILLGLPVKLQAQNEKIVVHSQADLPRFTYKVDKLPSELLTSDEAFMKLVEEVKKDILGLFEKYKIEDSSTLKGLYSTLENIAFFEEDYIKAEKYIEEVQNLQEKPSAKLMSGILEKPLIISEKAKDNKTEIFRKSLTASVEILPWGIVQDDVQLLKGTFEIISKNLITGAFQSQYDPAVKKTGTISGEIAQSIIGNKITFEKIIPFKDIAVEVFQKYIDKNKTEKKDIWAEREIALSESDKLTPVVIGIWDSGVDAAIYGSLMFQNKREALDNRDNDGNGYIDDIYGIAYDLNNDKTTGALFPLDENQNRRFPEMVSQIKGLMDIQSNIDSEEAKVLKQKMANMKPDEVSPFIEELSLFSTYMHATHVAGIASAGNPASRILIVRETFDYKIIPTPPSKADAERAAKNYIDDIIYFKEHGVRVVNMSWGNTQEYFESALEANGIGQNSEERAKLAKEMFNIVFEGIYNAIKSAPEILFVPAAGNSDANVEFDQFMPASIDLPNVMVAGAVDQAGDVTSFTSVGKSVDVYSNGFEVDSYIPGGGRMKMSGTSMSAPAVTNLAAKLFALDPALTPEKVTELIRKGADQSADGKRLLLNPQKTVALLNK